MRRRRTGGIRSAAAHPLRAPSPCGEARNAMRRRRTGGTRSAAAHKIRAAGGPPLPALRATSPCGGGKKREHRPIVGIPVTHEGGTDAPQAHRGDTVAGGPPPPGHLPLRGRQGTRAPPNRRNPRDTRRGDGCAGGAHGGTRSAAAHKLRAAGGSPLPGNPASRARPGGSQQHGGRTGNVAGSACLIPLDTFRDMWQLDLERCRIVFP